MKRKHFIYILAFLSFVLCIFFIQESYAKYLTSTSENASINVARWRILVNNKDIREGNTADAVIVPVFDGNENIASGIIAPTSEGYFDLVIDATEADVSFKYNINFSVNDDSAVSDLVATKYSINNGNVVDLNRDNMLYGMMKKIVLWITQQILRLLKMVKQLKWMLIYHLSNLNNNY